MLVAQMMRFGSESAERGYADGRFWKNQPMMGAWGNGSGFWLGSILCLIGWIIVLAVLISLARWLWYKGDNEKKRR